MMIAAHRLKEAGYEVTCYHPVLQEMQRWFLGYTFAELDLSDPQKVACDLAIVQNDNSKKVSTLFEWEKKGTIKKLSVFYSSYNAKKHHPLRFFDHVFDPKKTMTDNIAKAISLLIGSTAISKNNGLMIPKTLVHRRYLKRVIIHPLSSKDEKNWPLCDYKALAQELAKAGFQPVFAFHCSEPDLDIPFDKFICKNLDEMASFVYESGYAIGNDSLIGHLASNLVIPSVVIAECRKRMRMWRPGWLMGKVVTPPFWVPNVKFFRYRERHWKECITPKRVLKQFEMLQQ